VFNKDPEANSERSEESDHNVCDPGIRFARPGRYKLSPMAESAQNAERNRAQVLIVEDERDHAEVMAEALRKPGHVSTIVETVDEAMEELRHGSFDVIATDLRMPNSAGQHGTASDGHDAGLKVLQAARELQPNAETIMVTAHGDVQTARAAFKHGAYDFIEKPLDLELFRTLVNRAAETVLLRHQSGELEDLVQHDGFHGIIAGSEPWLRRTFPF